MSNGWASNFFSVHRGVRQGCPFSPYLFILSAEILAKAIRKNAGLSGLLVQDAEIKWSQYADDTTLIIDGSEKPLSEALRILESLEQVSGHRLNSKKTEPGSLDRLLCWQKWKTAPRKRFQPAKYEGKSFRSLAINRPGNYNQT